MPTLSLRRAGRAGHRQGPVPGPGGRLRRRRGPLLGPGRARAHRRGVRGARPGHRRAPGPRRRARRSSATTSRARPTTTSSTGSRATRRSATRCSPGADVVVSPGHALPARPPGADGDVRQRRQHGPGDRQAHRLVHEPGAARPPHALRARGRAARAQDPDHLARHRRRLRQQGRHLPRLRAGRRRLDRHRQAGEVGGGPLREPHVDGVRPRLPHARRDRRDPRRQDPRPAGRRARRPRRLQRHRPADEVPGRLLPHLHRQLRPRRRRTAR